MQANTQWNVMDMLLFWYMMLQNKVWLPSKLSWSDWMRETPCMFLPQDRFTWGKKIPWELKRIVWTRSKLPLHLSHFIPVGQRVLSDGRLCDGPHRDLAGSQCSLPEPGFLWRGSGEALQNAQTENWHAGANLQWYCSRFVLESKCVVSCFSLRMAFRR